MHDLWTMDYAGGAFRLFSGTHLTALALIALAIVAMLPLRRVDARARRLFRYGFAAVLFLNQVSWHVWHAANGAWALRTMLPLHLCGVTIIIAMIVLVRPNLRLYEILYFLGIGGAIQALLTPDLGPYGFPHFRFIQTFVAHGGIVAAALYMTWVEGYRPTGRSIGRAIVALHGYALFVFGANALLGTNYMYLMHKPETASLMDVLGPWPWYLVAVDAIALAVIGLLYAPWAAADLRRRALTPTVSASPEAP